MVVVESHTAQVSVLPMVESDTASVSVLPFAGSELPAVFLGKVALDVVGLGVGPPCLRLDSEETLPALIDERSEMSCTVPGVTLDGGPVEGAQVLEPIAHSVLGKPLDGGLQERMPVLEPLEHSVPAITWTDGPLEGTPVLEPLEHSVLEKFLHDEPVEEAPVLEPLEHSVLEKTVDHWRDWFVRLIMEPLEHSVLATTSVWEPLEHSNCVVTDHVDIDSLWMAPWDAGGTLGDSCRPFVASWRTVFRSVVRLSCRPAFVDEDRSWLFGSLGRICIQDVHVRQTDVPTGSPGDNPRMNLPPSLMSPSNGGVVLSLSVPPMGKSSRQSGSAGKGHSHRHGFDDSYVFSPEEFYPG